MRTLALTCLMMLSLSAFAQWPTHFAHFHYPGSVEIRGVVNQHDFNIGLSHSLGKKLRLQYSCDFHPGALRYGPGNPLRIGIIYLLYEDVGAYWETGISLHARGKKYENRFFHLAAGGGADFYNAYGQIWVQGGAAMEGKILDGSLTCKPHLHFTEGVASLFNDVAVTGTFKWRGIRPFVQCGVSVGIGDHLTDTALMIVSLGIETRFFPKKADRRAKFE